MTHEILLGVNIDHVATVREARGTRYPDPVQAAMEAQDAGADGITLHMREDLRHIQARDVRLIKSILQVPMNLELAVTDGMLAFAEEIRPEHACLVPEKREEITTEGGLDIIGHRSAVQKAVQRLQALGSEVSLFIDPDLKQIEAAAEVGAPVIEIHTGCYADATDPAEQALELKRIVEAAEYAANLNLIVNAGHGLHYHNVKAIAAIRQLRELNIGHAIIARAIFSGMKQAVKEMRQLMLEARNYA
ncbi:pyridoxine 5'-phosphate synthase [Legionella jordanis]|uniref:Pyridoxine 5'-phosphate synthase n=1 Tax=Legionella jordanis TaxID=456 RepID=A0A0W0V8D7_9GAMM|nr:pyridoxine 5'-phosphate synthase [Legionella jordanis]KTD16398.1 pyridoxal phosphate biosynthetic protein PdxJ [Legionella jordanis]RMX04399.1 pyridoxine 5'-phosphate synthase [Legionella jordanis]RMX15590.1 pyridoxine 5'-phosphate synthase [Legionella jordanis]VEH12141.1 pyridoxal phosphate biosynthetic protein PdxJ [Legionella jordanis]HAT8714961.1 pyridoxine 5'-phosphate synthase [Legionella jordanis]